MRVAIRTDAALRIGGGHVARCLALADELARGDAECRFITRAHPGAADEQIRAAGHGVISLPAPPEPTTRAGDTDYAAWLGVPQVRDAEETAAALADWAPDWLIVDHYGLDADWEQRLAPHARRLLVIDDLANRPHRADLLVDQTPAAEPEARYAGLLSANCRTVLGPHYALLRPAYHARRPARPPAPAAIKRIFVFFGSVDPDNLTGAALAALARSEFAHIAVDAVVGRDHPHCAELHARARTRPGMVVHGPQPDLAALMGAADLILGAGGTNTWERCTLGLPAVVMAIARNQCPGCTELHQRGAIRFLGHHRDCAQPEEALAAAVRALVAEPAALRGLAERSWLACDGLGAPRLTEVMRPSAASGLRLRPATAADAGLYHAWVNDPATRASAFHSEPIAWPEHADWFRRRLQDPDCVLRVLETAAGLPVGQARIERGDDRAVLSVSIDPAFRGRGWGSTLLALAAGEWCALGGDVDLVGEVRPANEASLAAFRRAGFRQTAADATRVEFRHTPGQDAGSEAEHDGDRVTARVRIRGREED